MTDTLTTTIAKEMDLHRRCYNGAACVCGWVGTDWGREHTEHAAPLIAAAVVSVSATHNEQVAADALRDAADFLEGKLGTPGIPHDLWEFRQWLRARADRLAAVSPTPPDDDDIPGLSVLPERMGNVGPNNPAPVPPTHTNQGE